MSISIGNNTFSNPGSFVRSKIQETQSQANQTQGMVDYVELMADGYLSLDNTATDENKKKGAVTFLKDGLYINAETDKSGNLKTFEMIDERGEDKQEIKKTMIDGRPSYTLNMAGQALEISEDANGTLVFNVL